jgi:hypothetical protein
MYQAGTDSPVRAGNIAKCSFLLFLQVSPPTTVAFCHAELLIKKMSSFSPQRLRQKTFPRFAAAGAVDIPGENSLIS